MELAMAVPVLPGKRGLLEEVAKACAGPKKGDFDASEKRVKIRKESWFIQSTPQGELCIFYADGDNVPKSVADWGASKDPFDLWLKGQLKEITGVDFNRPLPGPMPAELLRYG